MLKEGSPTVRQAMGLLHNEIAAARKSGVKVLRIIHGYGSSGEGGAIKAAVIKHLNSMKLSGDVASVLSGEDHFQYGASQNHLLRKYPELRDSWKSDRGNKGITFVEL